jgi:hypothetical protein
MSMGERSYSDASYGGHHLIVMKGGSVLASYTATDATPMASHTFMFPCRMVAAKIQIIGEGGGITQVTSGLEDLTQCTNWYLAKSTDTGTGMTNIGTADLNGASGTWSCLIEDQMVGTDFDLTATNFSVGDVVYLVCEGAWDDSGWGAVITMEVFEKFVQDDS